MKHLRYIPKFIVTFLFLILGTQFIISNASVNAQDVLGKWKYESHLYRKVGRYGPKEVDQIKSSMLCFTKDKIYFTNISLIDTCFYSGIEPKAFFDREDRESGYFLDGPLAVKYTEQQLGKFVRIDLNCKSNGFGTFYLNEDTLILNSAGGVTFFFTKQGSDSLIHYAKPSYRDIYSTDHKWGETIGKLKHDPSTKTDNYNYRLSDEGSEVRIEVYHISNRIITVEKRTFDKNNIQLTLEAFEFAENNDCRSCTQWNEEEKMSYIYAMHWGSLINYDVNCKLIKLMPVQKKQIIQSAKSSLDSVMLLFPEFKYSFNWR